MRKIISLMTGLIMGGVLMGCADVPDAAQVFYSQGLATINNNDPETGIEYKDAVLLFDESLTVKPNDYSTLIKRAYVAMQYREFQDGVIFYSKAIALKPNYYDLYNKRGEAYFRLQQYTSAVNDFQKSMVLNPSDTIAPLNLCYLFVASGQPQNALRYCDRVLALERGNPYALKLKEKIGKK